MSKGTVHSYTLIGLDAYPVKIEASPEDSSGFRIARLPAAAERETRVRVQAALASVGLSNPEGLVVDVTTAENTPILVSPQLDLAIACAVLAYYGKIAPSTLRDVAMVGELALDGSLRPVRGALLYAEAAVAEGKRILVHQDNMNEAIEAASARVIGFHTLTEVIRYFSDVAKVAKGDRVLPRPSARALPRGLLLIGPISAGKTTLARELCRLLPPLSHQERRETTRIHSIAGLIDSSVGFVKERPFRAPHHTVSEAGLVGGGSVLRPGEVSLAHNGVLFLDELLEFRRAAVGVLADTLTVGRITLCRNSYSASLPAIPRLLIASTCACPCGYYGSTTRECRCTPKTIARYRKELEENPIYSLLPVQIELDSSPPSHDHNLTKIFTALTNAIEKERAFDDG